MNIYVGNLSHETTEKDLRDAFEPFGHVESAKIITDKYTSKSRGFGFVEMPSRTEGESAISGLKDEELKGRRLNVNEARSRPGGRRGPGSREGGRRF
ncbi:MAG: RNA-binding protein [Deltaproteobacteria bacterium]|nr:RNA-binding protein [Deltaproteobacteria bacterium]MBW2020291.1 RNA-binding protein [Deltaproteobacteria bacterium]MBW2074774.1 RNA-binding protein [Deltaproteobacteria bacterium]RLB81415.1 MAG: RNA-binding protein [Deltaproteobacteria bacterium]